MSVLDMYNDFRVKFPEITKKADEEHIISWGEIDPDFAYSWFESLAKAINQKMHKGAPAKEYKDVFEFLRKQYLFGDDKVKDCIDVSFTENLFWQVQPSKAKNYWLLFPDLLKDLYVNFHRRKPC
jgi:hypothetical protein